MARKNEPGPVVWRTIGEAPRYEVSNEGGIRSLYASRGRRRVPRPLAPWLDRDGYAMVTLSLGQAGSRVGRRVSRLVLAAFVRPPLPAEEACHNNGDQADNRLENLRWDDRAGNIADQARHGTAYRGGRHHKTDLAPNDIQEIRRRIAAGHRGCDIAADFGVGGTCISNIKHGRTWAHLDGEATP